MAVVRRNFFYLKFTVNLTAFPAAPQIHFPFTANHIIIASDKNVEFSFGRCPADLDVDGEVGCSDGNIAFDGLQENRVWVRQPTINPDDPIANVRIWGWRKDQ